MKCPKCDYLGFETTDRCRNCGYDFSLSPSSSEPDLALRSADRNIEASADLDLTGLARPSDSQNTNALDLDRLFGSDPQAPAVSPTVVPTVDQALSAALAEAEASVANIDEPAAGVSELPFEETPHVPPPARAPLAVRRATPEIPRGRSRNTPRPVRVESSLLGLEASPETAPVVAPVAAPSLFMPPTLGARVGADAIDTVLLASLSATVLVLTLRIAGLAMTWEDLRVVPPVPFAGFLLLMAFCYFAAFTVAGGQTIGKMLMGIKVIGDDGRSVDATGGILRALGCGLVPLTLGLSYVPVLLTADRRALHDRLAGTRVICQ